VSFAVRFELSFSGPLFMLEGSPGLTTYVPTYILITESCRIMGSYAMLALRNVL
jgi:hypothetical protein